MLPKALKTCPKSNKSPNLVTLVRIGILKNKGNNEQYQNKHAFCQIRMIQNKTSPPEGRGLEVAHDHQHGQEAEGCGKDDRHKEEPFDPVRVADHAARVIPHVQELQVDVDTDGQEGNSPADAEVGLELVNINIVGCF